MNKKKQNSNIFAINIYIFSVYGSGAAWNRFL